VRVLSVVADNILGREFIASYARRLVMPTREVIENLPCWSCLDDRGADLRHALGQGALDLEDEGRFSPYSGLPLGCCRIRVACIMPRD
jgi:hypothetical protein